ncbi:TIGR01666 family membrane protein, partial [Acinetobacter baumannii]
QKIEDQQVLQLLLDCQQILNQSLFEQVSVDLNFIEQTLKQIQSLTTHEDFSESYTLVLKQMSLLLETLPELLTLKGKLLEQEIK